jgi:hypothetical protein
MRICQLVLVILGASSVLASLAGCVSSNATVGEPPSTCAKAGDTCTFSPGKLGLCVEPTHGGPLLCQSQH